jgi:hypothetical protein
VGKDQLLLLKYRTRLKEHDFSQKHFHLDSGVYTEILSAVEELGEKGYTRVTKAHHKDICHG